MHRCALWSAVLLTALLAPPSARAANVNVAVRDFVYVPSTVTIQVGDSVTWTNQGGTHNVLADDRSFRCANGCDGAGGNGNASSAAWTATRTFNQAGTFDYHCEFHGSLMSGTVIVEGGGGGGGGDEPGALRFSLAGYSVSEGTSTATITVQRILGDDGAVSVQYATGNGTAQAGSDYTAKSGTLSWADSDDASKTFTVSITNDTAAEGNETVNLTLSNPTGGAELVTPSSATLTITDNDGNPGNPPAAPTDLKAEAHSTSEMMLTWKDVSNETGYRIERKFFGGTYQEVAAVAANTTGFTVPGLSTATFYLFRVRAENGAGFSPYSNEASAATLGVVAPCAESPTALCVNNDRFRIEVLWRTGTGTGDGMAVPIPSAPDSGLFYFFSPSNLEMLLKVLNGCSLNNRYWVFFAATTDVELAVVVTDVTNGSTKSYYNPQGRPAPPIQDTNAFATCP